MNNSPYTTITLDEQPLPEIIATSTKRMNDGGFIGLVEMSSGQTYLGQGKTDEIAIKQAKMRLYSAYPELEPVGFVSEISYRILTDEE